MTGSSIKTRAVLTLLLWAGFWLLGLGLGGALLAVPFVQSTYGHSVELGGLLAGGLALLLLWAMRPRNLFTRTKADESPSLDRERHPQLFEFIEKLSRKSGARMPHKVYLQGQVNAFAGVERKWAGLKQTPVVGLGLPLFGFLSREELASVLAHEFGHHVGGDVALGPWIHKTRSSIGSAVESLEDSAFFLDVPFRSYGHFFLRVSSAVSREQELAADSLAAQVCGQVATTRALAKIAKLGPLWRAYWEFELMSVLALGVRVPIFEGFEQFLKHPRGRAEIARFLDEHDSRSPSLWDTHPPMHERLESISGRPQFPDLEAFSIHEDTLLLLGGREAAEAQWYELVDAHGLPGMTWQEVGSKVLLPHLAKQLAGTVVDPRRTPLSDLPALLDEGDGLWDRVRPAGLNLLSRAAKKQRSLRFLSDWLTSALYLRGFTPRTEPGLPLRMALEDQEVVPVELVEQLKGGGMSGSEYRTLAARWDLLPFV